jgi:hypothetical protein
VLPKVSLLQGEDAFEFPVVCGESHRGHGAKDATEIGLDSS